MARDEPVIDLNGLQLSNNTFSASPPGSLQGAEGCVMPQKGVIEPRRGQARFSTLPSASQIPFSMTEFQTAAIVNYATSKTDTSYGLGIANGTTTAFSGGPYNPVDDDGSVTTYARMRFGFAGGYMHFCTSAGPKTLESVASNPRNAGLLPMPNVSAGVQNPSVLSGVWLPNGYSVAYRSVLRKPTTDGTSLLSPPSGPLIVSNSMTSPVGQMSRTVPSGTTVTVVVADIVSTTMLAVGQNVTISPGEANFPAGTYVVASVNSLSGTFTYDDAHAAVAANNTAVQSFSVGTAAVAVSVILSADASTSTPVRLYRSRYTTTTSPSDEMFLVAEVYPNNTDISNGFVSINDTTPDSVIGPNPLYTNPSQPDGALGGNYAPPIYRDTAQWSSRMWYADTTARHSIDIQILGVGSPGGLQNNDTITFNKTGATSTPYVFTFKSPYSAGSTNSVLTTNSTPSINIYRTAQLFVNRFNVYMGTVGRPLVAYYVSAQNDTPGKIRIESTDYSAVPIQIKVSRPTAWVPALSSSTYTDSVAEYIPSGLTYSKLGQAEACPLLNTTTIGAKNYAIAKICALEQALIVFKSGDGIYAVTGDAPFNVQQISVANIIAPDAACVFADNVWAYTDQGVLKVNNSGGVTVVSRPIETELNDLRAQFPSETHDYAFMVPYEQERRLLLFVPDSATGTNGLPTLRAFCFNNATQAWTGPLYTNAFSGIVSQSAAKLLLGIYDTVWSAGRVTLERKGNADYRDYADASFSATITDVDSSNLVITVSSATDIEVGDGIEQGSYRTKIESVDGLELTLFEPMPFTATTCTIYKGYDFRPQLLPLGSPSTRKSLTRLAFLFKPEEFESYTSTATVLTDQIQADLDIDMPSTGFGLQPFGSNPFGDPTPLSVDVNPIDPKWTNAAQFFIGMEAREAWMKIKLQGLVARLEDQSAPGNRGSR